MPKHLCQKAMAVFAVSGLTFLVACGNETNTSSTDNAVVVQAEPSISPAPQSIVKPEHQGKPVYTDEANNQYMVLT